MRLEESEKLNNSELRTRVNECFELAETPGKERGPLYEQARFYRWIIEQRENARVATRDFILEIIVIALILLEIIVAIGLAWYGGRQQSKEVAQELKAFAGMQTVLSDMQASSAATASTMVELKNSMDEVKTSLDKQVALYYDVSLVAVFDPEKKQINIANAGRTSVSLWGEKLGNELDMENEGRTVGPGTMYTVVGNSVFDLAVNRFPKPVHGLIPYDIYLKNERGEEFVQYGYIAIRWSEDVPILTVQATSVTPEKWSKTKKKP